jgi:hypothetical protein
MGVIRHFRIVLYFRVGDTNNRKTITPLINIERRRASIVPGNKSTYFLLLCSTMSGNSQSMALWCVSFSLLLASGRVLLRWKREIEALRTNQNSFLRKFFSNDPEGLTID